MTELQIAVRVRAKGAGGFYFETFGPNPTIPRVGEYVEFADGMGRVETVTWKPDTSKGDSMLIVVECVPDPRPRESS